MNSPIQTVITCQVDKAVEEIAKVLFTKFKESMEEQGVPYAFWDTLDSRNKTAWLAVARSFLEG